VESKPHSVLCHVHSRPGADRRHAFQLSLDGFFRLRFLASDGPINPGELVLGPTPFTKVPSAIVHCVLVKEHGAGAVQSARPAKGRSTASRGTQMMHRGRLSHGITPSDSGH